jgi:tetratricopeptide (TPR) repeat protein
MRKRPFSRQLVTRWYIRIVPLSVLPPPPSPVLRSLWLLLLLLIGALPLRASLEDTNSPTPAPIPALSEATAQEALRALHGLESQLRASQSALEQSGKEAREAADRQTELLSRGFQALNDAFSAQQQALANRSAQELQAIHSSNRVTAIAGTTFAVLASLAILTIAYFQWRISKVWTDLSLGLPAGRGLADRSDVLALGPMPKEPAPISAMEEASLRLLRSLEQLEVRVQGLERTPSHHRDISPPGIDPESPDSVAAGSNGRKPEPTLRVLTDEQERITGCLDQAQTFSKANDWEAALKCYDEVLSLDPQHGEALVKKGVALERLKKLNEAFECYDRAIALDDSLTIAYLHKGGLCSRLERFKEALECYEKALTKHHDW